jgi:hypothetical protein
MANDWKELCKAASREQDPKKLLELVEKIDQALEQCENVLKEKTRSPGMSDNDRESNLYPMLPITNVRPLSA